MRVFLFIGIVLSWNMTVNESHAEIASYQLFAYQEGSTPPTTALWKKVCIIMGFYGFHHVKY